MSKRKILVIRFSSIGDIVMTSPVVRTLSNKGYKVHFLVKEKFLPVIEANPYIRKIHIFTSIQQSIQELSAEQFDFIVDLQNNRNSRILCWRLGTPNSAFPKLNIEKFLVVLLKIRSILPAKHIVDRYFEAVKQLGVKNDYQGLDFFMDESKISQSIRDFPKPYVIIVVGGSYTTKKIPLNKLREIITHLSNKKILLLGDQHDFTVAQQLSLEFENAINLCGQTNLHESAYLIKHAAFVISSDTGLMHIAAAFRKIIYSFWGNTIPEFGMYPYMPDMKSKIIQNNHVWCRPCSKLGYQRCPLLHFKCMNDLNISEIVTNT